ncbi:unnamed protein product, partial [Chrysoparadoxa australica]
AGGVGGVAGASSRKRATERRRRSHSNSSLSSFASASSIAHEYYPDELLATMTPPPRHLPQPSSSQSLSLATPAVVSPMGPSHGGWGAPVMHLDGQERGANQVGLEADNAGVGVWGAVGLVGKALVGSLFGSRIQGPNEPSEPAKAAPKATRPPTDTDLQLALASNNNGFHLQQLPTPPDVIAAMKRRNDHLRQLEMSGSSESAESPSAIAPPLELRKALQE